MNRRTNNGVTGTFVVDTKNELTNAPSSVNKQTYDSNGNLLTGHDGNWVYDYDDENRLTMLIRTNGADITLTEFFYDGLGRLREREEFIPASGGSGESLTVLPDQWSVVSDARYIYDGWRVIQERDGSNNPLVSYTRGDDLSGSMEGAGGIGGLLARSSGYSGGNFTTHNYYFADGNGSPREMTKRKVGVAFKHNDCTLPTFCTARLSHGANITYMLNSSQGMTASYRYDPFGNTISSSGRLATNNAYRFSSKEIHVNSGMYYYGYRFYDPNLQRWINRDPVGEAGGINLYDFCVNSPVTLCDPEGLQSGSLAWCMLVPPPKPPPPPPCNVDCNLAGSPASPYRVGPILYESVTDTYDCADCKGNTFKKTNHRTVIIVLGPNSQCIFCFPALKKYQYAL